MVLYVFLLIALGAISFYIFRQRIDQEAFAPVDLNEHHGKTIAEYFMENLKMPEADAKKAADMGVSFYVTENMTLDALISNLAYYGLVKDEEALRYALEHVEDTHPAIKPKAIKIGKNDIDRGVYGIGAKMTAWQVATILVNYPQEIKTDYGKMFMPGGPYMGEPRIRPPK